MQIRIARVIPPLLTACVSLPRFSPPESFFFLTRFACPPRALLRLVREFSWLAELTAFGKIASSTHRTRGYQRGPALTRRYPPRLLRVTSAVSLSVVPTPVDGRRSLFSDPSSTQHYRCITSARTVCCITEALGRGSFRRVGRSVCVETGLPTCVNAGLRRVFRSSSQFRVHT